MLLAVGGSLTKLILSAKESGGREFGEVVRLRLGKA